MMSCQFGRGLRWPSPPTLLPVSSKEESAIGHSLEPGTSCPGASTRYRFRGASQGAEAGARIEPSARREGVRMSDVLLGDPELIEGFARSRRGDGLDAGAVSSARCIGAPMSSAGHVVRAGGQASLVRGSNQFCAYIRGRWGWRMRYLCRQGPRWSVHRTCRRRDHPRRDHRTPRWPSLIPLRRALLVRTSSDWVRWT